MGRVNGIKPEAQRLMAALILELTILGLKRAWQGTERELTLKIRDHGQSDKVKLRLNICLEPRKLFSSQTQLIGCVQNPVSIHKGVNAGQAGGKKPYQLNIKPSQKAIKSHYDKCKTVIKTHRTAPQSALIEHLNPVIRGWSNYYSKVVSKSTFSKLDYLIWGALRAWTVSRCGKASYDKLKNYYGFGVNGNWTFQTKDGLRLTKHAETPIKRHIKVKGEKSPHDGDWTYWSKRMSNGYTGISNRVTKLIKRQKGRCTYCGLTFTSNDLIEVDHILPQSRGGKDTYKNLQALHRHCHDSKTRRDGSLNRDDCTHDKG